MSQLTFAALRQRLNERVPVRAMQSGRIEAAVAIVLAPDEQDALHLLFVRRAEVAADPWSGQMALPGGRREAQDPDLLTTATRETFEETGVRLEAETLLGELDDLAPVTPTLPPIAVRPFVFGLPARPVVRPSSEVALHVWAALDGLPAAAGESEIAIRGAQLTVPSYRVGSHVVWGMTQRIIRHLLDLAI